MADFNKILETSRKQQWAAIAGGINALFLDDLNKNGPVSSSKFTTYQKQIETIKGEQIDPTLKVESAKKIRKLFRGKDELDHFLFICGLEKAAPINPSMRIRAAIMSNR